MKVKELIAALQGYDEDMEVFVPSEMGYYGTSEYVTADVSVGKLNVCKDFGYVNTFVDGVLTKVIIIE